MPGTRYAAPGSNPDASPERYLSSPKLAGLAIGMNIVCKVARARRVRERKAMIWCANFSRLRGLTADELCDDLKLGKAEIREALTNPDGDLSHFVRRIEDARSSFEASIRPPVKTVIFEEVVDQLEFARDEKVIAEIIGKNQMGKSDGAWDFYLRNLDRALYIKTPESDSERVFHFENAQRLGVSTSGKKAGQLIGQIATCFGDTLIDTVLVDEGHFLWPNDFKLKPKRLEYWRGLWDSHTRQGGIGIGVIATPQHLVTMNYYLANSERWAPGQWQGRAIRHLLPDTMSETDLRSVAKWHLPDADEPIQRQLALAARATEGYCGFMVNCIKKARRQAKKLGRNRIILDDIMKSIAGMIGGTKIAALAKGAA
jgi:hypothetical protein